MEQNEWDICPDSETRRHVPDIGSLSIVYDGDEAYFDINCSLCGRSGCAAVFDPEKVDW